MKMKNVLLIGIGGVYNYGCEAIVRGTIEILRNVDPAIKISYASYNYEDDVQRLADCDLKILQRKRLGRWNPKNIIRKLLTFVGISFTMPYDSTDWLNEYDTVFSIGGDLYTLTKQFLCFLKCRCHFWHQAFMDLILQKCLCWLEPLL